MRIVLPELCCDRHPPDAIAIIEDGGPRVTFGELRDRSERIAAGLAVEGIRRNDRVAVTLPQGADCLATHLAILRLGAISVPIAAVFSPDAVRFRLDDSGATVHVDASERVAALAAHAPRHGGEAMDADDPAFILYTSGTTGTPKGAVLPQRVVHGHLPGFEAVFDEAPQPGDVFWTPSDWSWIGALGEVVLPVAFHGYPLVATAGRFSVTEAYRVLVEHGVTCPFLAPAVIRRMRAEPPADVSGIRLRAVMSGGEALAADVRADFEAMFGCTLNDIFGATEGNHLASGCAARFATPPGAIGRAVPGRRIAIIDGEICLAADDPIVMLGYWRRPDLTAQKIRDGWLHLGDRGRIDEDGFLWFEGRVDDLIKVSGIQVGAEEVEAALLAHPAVAEAGVCGVPRADGMGDTVAAFVRLRPGHELDVAALQGIVRERIGPHASPRVVEAVATFPMTSSGKIQRRELRRAYDARPAVHSPTPRDPDRTST